MHDEKLTSMQWEIYCHIKKVWMRLFQRNGIGYDGVMVLWHGTDHMGFVWCGRVMYATWKFHVARLADVASLNDQIFNWAQILVQESDWDKIIL